MHNQLFGLIVLTIGSTLKVKNKNKTDDVVNL